MTLPFKQSKLLIMNYTLSIKQFKNMLNNPTVSNLELVQVSKGNSRFGQLLAEKDEKYFVKRTVQEMDLMIEQAQKAMEEIMRDSSC